MSTISLMGNLIPAVIKINDDLLRFVFFGKYTF